MKYVCIDYRGQTNTVQTIVLGDTIISNKFTVHDQTFVTYKGKNYAVIYQSEYDSTIRDFITLINFAYRGLNVNFDNN